MCQPELKYLYAFNINKINISIKSNIKLDDFVDLELSSHNLIDDEKHRILVIQLNDNQELINYANYYLKKNFLIEDEFNVP
ncbi:MAG: hypothetical protein RR744_09545, partial [Cellulosilyticaceae bacterium]